MLVLGIESSCDETAAAVVWDGKKILSNVVFSQVDIHKTFGGVVPELASRKHIETISVVIADALTEAEVAVSDIEGIGVTRGPGLIGSLLVGISAAKGLALALNLPIAGVNHLHGHLSAILLENEDLELPFMALVVSGGHTSLYHVKSWALIEKVGRTRDDAAGEAFDKVAKLLGLGYPGGVVIERQSHGVNPEGLRFPRALMEPGNLDFSFSGLKTAVLRQVEQMTGLSRDQRRPGSFHPLVSDESRNNHEKEIKIIAAAFQNAVVDVLAAKAVAAAKAFGCRQLVVCGGVAANKSLRHKTQSLAADNHVEAIFPSVALCTDNAAMIGARADFLLSNRLVDDLNFNAKSRW